MTPLAGVLEEPELSARAAAIIASVRQPIEAEPPTHRALGDAMREHHIWLEIGAAARAYAEGPRQNTKTSR